MSEFYGDKGLKEKDITTTKDVKVIKSFSDMKLKPLLLRGIYAFGFKSPSAIQQRAIVPLIKGRDVIAQAQSGTGKTATFSIGILQRIDENLKKTQALVLSPTRELSVQINKVLLSLGDYLNIQCHACYGGTDLKRDIEKIKLGVHVVSGTPGRVYDMIQRGVLNVKFLKMLILDEADEMLNKGFEEKIAEVYKCLPDLTQVCLVSATLPDEILEISEKFMTDPIKILVKRDELTVDAIKQFYLNVEKEEWKFDNLCYFINQTIKFTHIIIFCNKRRKVDWLTKKLKDAKFPVSSLHGKIRQKDREDIMNKLRTFQTRVLVTTDLCARGIDVKQISVVINFDLPTSREVYIHRIGRSGRFGKKSIAITLIKNEDKPILEDLRKNYKMKLEPLPKNFVDYI